MEQIRTYFQQHSPLTEDDWTYFSSKLSQLIVPKSSYLLRAGQTEQHLNFIESGVTRFFLPLESSELTFAFAFSGEFVSGYHSFLTQKPAPYYIQALSECRLWRINHADLQKVYQNTKAGEAIGRWASETLYLKKAEREHSLLSRSAQERYLDLFTTQPKLIKEIPLKYIASYIGISPQALSRIRRRIS